MAKSRRRPTVYRKIRGIRDDEIRGVIGSLNMMLVEQGKMLRELDARINLVSSYLQLHPALIEPTIQEYITDLRQQAAAAKAAEEAKANERLRQIAQRMADKRAGSDALVALTPEAILAGLQKGVLKPDADIEAAVDAELAAANAVATAPGVATQEGTFPDGGSSDPSLPEGVTRDFPRQGPCPDCGGKGGYEVKDNATNTVVIDPCPTCHPVEAVVSAAVDKLDDIVDAVVTEASAPGVLAEEVSYGSASRDEASPEPRQSSREEGAVIGEQSQD